MLFLPEFFACPGIEQCLDSVFALLHEDPDGNGSD